LTAFQFSYFKKFILLAFLKLKQDFEGAKKWLSKPETALVQKQQDT
jgi:hypothetical protein